MTPRGGRFVRGQFDGGPLLYEVVRAHRVTLASMLLLPKSGMSLQVYLATCCLKAAISAAGNVMSSSPAACKLRGGWVFKLRE